MPNVSPGVHVKQWVSAADVERGAGFYWNSRPHLGIIILNFGMIKKTMITSNLADELLAKLMIGLVLATQEWLSMLGGKS